VPNVTIFRFQTYDVRYDQMHTSKRWGTREGIEKWTNGRVLEDTAAEVDASSVASDLPGLTETGFDPRFATGYLKRAPI
jgi:hypothetical protein